MPVTFTPEEVERFKTDREFFFNYRHTLENIMNASDRFKITFLGCSLTFV